MDILKAASECFQGARESVGNGIALLYKIREEGLFRGGGFSSFGQYVAEECGLNTSQISRYLTQYEYYCITNGISNTKLVGIDPEKTYAAMKLRGSAEEQLAKAATLSIKEIKAQNIYEKTGQECTHEKQGVICFSCSKRL